MPLRNALVNGFSHVIQITLELVPVSYTEGGMGSRHELPEGARIRVLTASGGVHVIAEDRSGIDVEPAQANVQTSDDRRVVEIKSRSKSFTIRCPTGTNVSVGSISGGVKLEGTFGSIKISAISGSVDVDRARGDVDIRSVSGGIRVERCGGRCSLGTKSGSIRVGRVGGDIKASTISGSLQVGTDGLGAVNLKAVSGSMTVNIPPEKKPRVQMKSLSGKLKCECEQGSDFEIKGSSISGSLLVKET
jgi:DUF4097 and DUF4098 domain-containing protein YvlB